MRCYQCDADINGVTDNAIDMCEECQQAQVVEDGVTENGDLKQNIIVNELLMYMQYHMSMTAIDVLKKRSVGFIIQPK